MASELIGAKELSAKLDRLSAKLRGSVLRKAANNAVKPVIAAARSNLSSVVKHNPPLRLHKTYKGRLVAPGFAERNVAAKVSISRDRRAVFAKIGVRSEAFYAINFVELNTSRRHGTPWLRPAFESTQGSQLTAFVDVFRREILKVASAKG